MFDMCEFIVFNVLDQMQSYLTEKTCGFITILCYSLKSLFSGLFVSPSSREVISSGIHDGSAGVVQLPSAIIAIVSLQWKF